MARHLGQLAAAVLAGCCTSVAVAQAEPAAANGRKTAATAGQSPTVHAAGDAAPDMVQADSRAPAPVRPELPPDAAAEIEALLSRIQELKTIGLTAPSPEAQDDALDEAISLAERILAIRLEHQGNTPDIVRWRDASGQPSEWYEVLDARRAAASLRRIRELDAAGREELRRTDELDARASELYDEGDFESALDCWLQLLDIYTRTLGENDPAALATRGDLYLLYRILGFDDEAEAAIRNALAGQVRALGEEHPRTLLSMSDLGFVLALRGEVTESVGHATAAVAGLRRTLDPTHKQLARALNNLGAVLQYAGQLSEAEAAYRESLRHAPVEHSEADINVRAAVSNLGTVLADQGRFAEAEPYYRRTLDVARSMLGEEHYETLHAMNNLGHLLDQMGRLPEAESLLRRAAGTMREALGAEHPLTLTCLGNLASTLDAQGRRSDAETYYKLVYSVTRGQLGDDHPLTIDALNNVAFILEGQGRVQEAEPLYRLALESSRRVYGEEHPATLTFAGNLANLLGPQDPEAIDLLHRTTELLRRTLGDDHPETLRSIMHLGIALWDQGKADEARPYLQAALDGSRRAVGDAHPNTINLLNLMGSWLLEHGRPAEAEPLFAAGLGAVEQLRTQTHGSVVERASMAGELQLARIAGGHARALAALGREEEALHALERGRARAGLDLFAGGRADAERILLSTNSPEALDEYMAAVAAEAHARSALFEAEARLAAAADDEREARRGQVQAAQVAMKEATAAAFAQLRGLVPAAAPLDAHEVLASLEPAEGLLSYSITVDGAIALAAHNGRVRAVTLASSREESARLANVLAALRDRIATRPAAGETQGEAAFSAARDMVLPPALRDVLAGCSSLTVVAEGPLTGIPFEVLLDGVPIAYAPSATIAIDRRRAARDRIQHPSAAVVLGDPDFSNGQRKPELNYPEAGVLLAMVQDGGNAAQAGLRRGDVLLSYGEHSLGSVDDLFPAIEATAEALATRSTDLHHRPVTAEVWRQTEDGTEEVITVNLAPGRLGVELSSAAPADGLRSMALVDRSPDAMTAEVAALEQVRLYGGALSPLPATRLEASAVAAMFGRSATLLLGQEATAPRLRQSVEQSPPRVLHLATHGLMGSSDRPLLASVALSTPQTPSPEDIGFVTLDDIFSTWGGSLRGTELVVLSACDTARGQLVGDTAMSLPLGFFVCGAETVIASLWKVDDTATALLMARFYANWLGKTGSEREIDGRTYAAGEALSKLAALREAQAWLRSLTAEQVRRIKSAAADDIAGEVSRDPSPRRGRLTQATDPSSRPYDHSYYWAAFTLYGSAE